LAAAAAAAAACVEVRGGLGRWNAGTVGGCGSWQWLLLQVCPQGKAVPHGCLLFARKSSSIEKHSRQEQQEQLSEWV
jgi:hypothetical protein